MHFDVTQSFDATAAEVFEVYRSARLIGSLPQFGRLSAGELVGSDTDGDVAVVRVRYRFVGDLPAAALKVVDRDKLSWVEVSRYDAATLSAAVSFEPDHYANKLIVSATVRFHDVGTGSVRSVDGDLKVKVPLVGGTAERAIVSGLREHLDTEAVYVAELLSHT